MKYFYFILHFSSFGAILQMQTFSPSFLDMLLSFFLPFCKFSSNFSVLTIVTPPCTMRENERGLVMFDFHVHTHHSFDASHTANELIEKAIQLGLTQICLTDHIDYDYDGEGSEFSFSYQGFFDEISRVRQLYKNQIQLLAGVEFGMQPISSRNTKRMPTSGPSTTSSAHCTA